MTEMNLKLKCALEISLYQYEYNTIKIIHNYQTTNISIDNMMQGSLAKNTGDKSWTHADIRQLKHAFNFDSLSRQPWKHAWGVTTSTHTTRPNAAHEWPCICIWREK